MVFIDLHCHIDIYSNLDEILKNAKKLGVLKIINAGVDVFTNRKSLEISKKYPEVFCALGVYPTEALKMSEVDLQEEISFIRKNKDKIVAIGEVGIDLKEGFDLERQTKNFRKFIRLSKELDIPIIVHSRKAEKECVEVLKEENAKKVVMHCFSGKKKLIERIRDEGWFFSVPTNINNSEHFQELVRMVPIEQLFCETDSPFLHPLKERNNEPANVIYSYKKISEIKGVSLKEVGRKIEKNFEKIFRNSKSL